MPYITPEQRELLDPAIKVLFDALRATHIGPPRPGDVNYCISKLVWSLFEDNVSYTNGQNLIGTLACVQAEFYRRKLAPYEDQKLQENGDVILC